MSAIDYWPGARKSAENAFTGSTGAAPIVWATPGEARYATRVNNEQGNALDSRGRPTVPLDPHVSGISIATAEDKKFKRKRGAAI